ncbi:MAG: hypothetical protein H6Q74_2448 [Firmicutes bacterium]|nr:hypothetical protein [Bacillota bacterium]
MKILRSKRGSILILAALAFTAILGLAALVIDAGNLYMNRIQLATIADASALAAARQLLTTTTETPAQAAQELATLNGKKSTDQLTVTINNHTVTVTASRKITFLFAPLLGLTSSNVTASATATTGVLGSATGVVPFGIEQKALTYGVSYVLKNGGGSGNTGNFGAVALGGSGANTYRENIENGYSGTLHIGDKIYTEPGNMSGPTTTGVNYRITQDPTATFPPSSNSPRIVTVPIVDSMDVNGRKQVTIVGFAAFFLEGVGGSGNNNYVTGQFIEMVQSGDLSTADTYYGVYNIKLTQ